MSRKKKGKAIVDTEKIIANLVSNEVAKTETLLRQKQRESEEEFHNAVVNKIQELNLTPQSVVFVLDVLKSEILEQFLQKVVRDNV